MLCFNCGKETDNLDKICDACRVAASPGNLPGEGVRRARASALEEYRAEKIPFLSWKPLVFILLAIAAWYWLPYPAPLKYEDDGRNVTLSDGSGKNYISYERGNALVLKGVAIDADPRKASLASGGIAMFMAYLAPDDYAQFQNDYIRTGRCPAPFLNARAKIVALVPGSVEQEKSLKEISLERGDEIQISGVLLSFREGASRGHPTQFTAGNATMMQLRQISVTHGNAL